MRKMRSKRDGSFVFVVEYIEFEDGRKLYILEDLLDEAVVLAVLGSGELGVVDLDEISPFTSKRVRRLEGVDPAPGWTWN